MKKSLLKFLPLMAAVLLATSCKKDDDNNAPANGRDGEHTVSTSTIPFSIKVNTGNSLKKVCYIKSTDENKKGYYSVSFDKDDYEDELKMVIKQGDQEIGALSLEKDFVTFSGDLSEFKKIPEEGAELTAVVTTDGKEGSEAFSDESLEDLFKTCAHTYEGKFIFKYADKDANVTLTDQNVYLAIAMSPCCAHEITINNETFKVQNGSIWIAVPAKDGVKSVGLGKEINETEPNPGEIHNVIRQYFTVSSNGKKVYFSKGNLQYNPKATPQWRFAEHQWDFIGGSMKGSQTEYTFGTVEGCTNNGAVGPWIDLFGWGTWLKDYANPSNTSKNTSDYPSQSAYDKGTTAIGKEWVVLQTNESSNDLNNEWKYLFKDQIFGIATIKIKDINDVVKDITGVVVLPHDWETPDGISFKSGCGGDWSKNTYDEKQWAIMEAAGAVFLPKAGQRDGESFSYSVNGPGYWSSTSKNNTDVYYYYVSNSQGSSTGTYRYYGKPVRLVRVLN